MPHASTLTQLKILSVSHTGGDFDIQALRVEVLSNFFSRLQE